MNNCSRFYRSRLNPAEKSAYDAVCGALRDRRRSVGVSGAGIDPKAVINAVLFDDPAFFYINKNVMIFKTPLGAVFSFRYIYSEKETKSIADRIDRRIDEFIKADISDSMPPLGRQVAVHRWLTTNVKPAQNRNGRELYSIVGAFINGECLCEGFSKAYKLLCDRVGLPSIVVRGIGLPPQGTREPHAWNITKIGDLTAHTDVTWDAIYGAGSYDYFNLPDSDISKDHIFDKMLYPVCESDELSYFRQNGAIAENEDELKEIIAKNGLKPYFSVKLLFPATREQIAAMGFKKGKLYLNESQNIVGWRLS